MYLFVHTRRRGNQELSPDAAGHRSLVFDLSITHDRIGSSGHVQQNGLLSHPQDLDDPLSLAAQPKVNSYRQQHTDNQNISFLPAIMPTSSRMHGEFFASSFSTGPLRDHSALNCHWIVTKPIGQYVPVQKRCILHGLKSKVCLVSAKASALLINLNIQGCVVAGFGAVRQLREGEEGTCTRLGYSFIVKEREGKVKTL